MSNFFFFFFLNLKQQLPCNSEGLIPRRGSHTDIIIVESRCEAKKLCIDIPIYYVHATLTMLMLEIAWKLSCVKNNTPY